MVGLGLGSNSAYRRLFLLSFLVREKAILLAPNLMVCTTLLNLLGLKKKSLYIRLSKSAYIHQNLSLVYRLHFSKIFVQIGEKVFSKKIKISLSYVTLIF